MLARFRLMLLVLLGLGWCAGLCSERPAWAQPAQPGQLGQHGASGPKLPLGDRRLTQLLAQGQAALSRKDAEAAVRAFEDAFRYSPRPVLLYYLGKAAQLSQRGAAAVDLLRRFLEAVGEDVEPEVRTEVQHETAQRLAILAVTDQGPGVPPDLLPNLFERFVKTRSSPGLGLGLYLARRIARAHGGELTVHSQPGLGACFRLTLPIEPVA